MAEIENVDVYLLDTDKSVHLVRPDVETFMEACEYMGVSAERVIDDVKQMPAGVHTVQVDLEVYGRVGSNG